MDQVRAMSTAQSPRIVPGAAFCGFVAPIMPRITSTAFFPSMAIATRGRDIMNSDKPPKNGFSTCSV